MTFKDDEICGVGIDFGTTNSVVSIARGDGRTEAASFSTSKGNAHTFRSVLCFWLEEDERRAWLESTAGPAAIEQYLKDPFDARLIMSMKSYLANRLFIETRIFGYRHTLEQIISTFLGNFFNASGLEPSALATSIAAGRPVRFAGENPDDAFGLERLAASYRLAGIDAPGFFYEPEGAAYHYARSQNEEKILLVADFGGGTSDFSLVKISKEGGATKATPLNSRGIGIAGDAFDYRIIDHVVAPHLGKGSAYKSFGKVLPVPTHHYAQFARWHQLSHLKDSATRRELREIASGSENPLPIESLIKIIDDELGFSLYEAVALTKSALSQSEKADFSFRVGELVIKQSVDRDEFNAWIQQDLELIAQTVDETFKETNLRLSDVDQVFVTGGTSFVPAVRDLMADRFGREKIDSGNEFQSVAEGLALIARDQTLSKT